MEREITFRGKGEFTGKWIYGYYVKIGKMDYICTGEVAENNHLNDYGLTCCSPVRHAVDPTTVGQYTGQDIQGVKLFDGDIIRRNDGMVFRVAWSNLFLGWDAHGAKLPDNFSLDVVLSKGPCEIIGNIWDTPELLEVKK